MNDEADRTPSWDGFGQYLRAQRQLAKLTLRQLAALADVSNPYLSQIERGLHRPSLAVLKSIADALDVSVDAMLQQAGVMGGPDPDAEPPPSTEAAIRADPCLSADQKSALLAVYRSMTGDTGRAGTGPATRSRPPEPGKSA